MKRSSFLETSSQDRFPMLLRRLQFLHILKYQNIRLGGCELALEKTSTDSTVHTACGISIWTNMKNMWHSEVFYQAARYDLQPTEVTSEMVEAKKRPGPDYFHLARVLILFESENWGQQPTATFDFSSFNSSSIGVKHQRQALQPHVGPGLADSCVLILSQHPNALRPLHLT